MASLPSELHGFAVHYWLTAGIHNIPVHICACGLVVSLLDSPPAHLSECPTKKEKPYA